MGVKEIFVETGSSPVELFCHPLEVVMILLKAVELRLLTYVVSVHSPSGIYRCDIAFDSDEPLARETFYVGVYNNGGIYR